jgi:HAD superfamily hydrolase (TIGR01509 family)
MRRAFDESRGNLRMTLPELAHIPLNTEMNQPWGVLFDWDGVVIDSSSQHERSWELLAAERDLELPEGHFKAGFGKKNEVIIPALGWAEDPLLIAALADRKEELYRGLVAAEGVLILPGARELLAALKAAGIPRAVGSSTPRGNLDALFAATGLDAYFDKVVCGSDVLHGKPDPEVFLKGASLLGLPSERCIVIEDAFAGIEAARRAGMLVVGVATTNPVEQLDNCDLAVQSLAEVTPAILADLVGESAS